MTTSTAGSSRPGPTPHQRLLALRVIPSRLQLLATLTTCSVGPVDAMAIDRILQRVMADQDVLMHGCEEHVQGVLDVDLEAWGRWVVGEMYPTDRLEHGRSIVTRYMATWNDARTKFSRSPETRIALDELRQLVDDVEARLDARGL